ncbi:MAG: NAD(P)-dependent alcohol dehydrogenase [Anaerolineales bacterium]|nr:NAD(P)-dependent alcohol dehydrogenase [Anaerolineales bacterium]
MKAMVYERYGPPDVFQLKEVPTPAPGVHEVLVRIRATTVRTGDWRMRKADPFLARLFNGLFRPRRQILGFELAGDVVAIGAAVTKFKPGDAVMASCGLDFGAYAEYRCVAEDGVMALKPAGLSYPEAAALPSGGLAALANLRRGQIQAGAQVLIYGASGSVGSYAVQLARHCGAEVTGVCSGRNHAWVQALGATATIDYTQEAITSRPERYDLIFNAVGKEISAVTPAEFKRLLRPGGRYLSINDGYKEEAADLVYLGQLAEAGDLRVVIDRCYPLAEMAAAHRYVEAGHKRGNVVILVEPAGAMPGAGGFLPGNLATIGAAAVR